MAVITRPLLTPPILASPAIRIIHCRVMEQPTVTPLMAVRPIRLIHAVQATLAAPAIPALRVIRAASKGLSS
jgi:hypothetical protein